MQWKVTSVNIKTIRTTSIKGDTRVLQDNSTAPTEHLVAEVDEIWMQIYFSEPDMVSRGTLDSIRITMELNMF